MPMRLEGVEAPFHIVMEGTDKVASDIKRITDKLSGLERITLGKKGLKLDVSGPIKALDDLQDRITKTLGKVEKISIPKAMKGTASGMALDKIFGKQTDNVIERVTTINSRVLALQDTLQALSASSEKRVLPRKELEEFNTLLGTVTASIADTGQVGVKHFSDIAKKLEKVKAIAGEHFAKAGGAQMDAGKAEALSKKLDEALHVDTSGLAELSDFFDNTISEIESKLHALGTAKVPFTSVGESMVADISKAFKDVSSVWREQAAGLKQAFSALSLDEELASQLLSPKVTDALARVEERSNKLFASKDRVEQLRESLEDPDASQEERGALTAKLRTELAEAEQLMRKTAEGNKTLSDSFFAQQSSMLAQLKKNSAEAGTEFSGNTDIIAQMADKTLKLKQSFSEATQKIQNGSNALREQAALNKKIVAIISEGGDVEAEHVAEQLKSIDVYKNAMDYAEALATAEKKIASARGNSVDALKTSLALQRKQAEALRTATAAGTGDSAQTAFTQLQRVQRNIASETSKISMREEIMRIGEAVTTGALPSLKKLTSAINTFEATSGKSFKEQTTDVQLLGKALTQMVGRYEKLGKSTTNTGLHERAQLLQSIEDMNQRVGQGTGSDTEQARYSVRQNMLKTAKEELQVQKERAEFENKLAADFNKIQALQIAGVGTAKNYQKIQELYLTAKRNESSLEQEITNTLKNKRSVVSKLLHEVKGLQQAGQDSNLLPGMQEQQLKGALDTLQLIKTMTTQMEGQGSPLAKEDGVAVTSAEVDRRMASIKEELQARSLAKQEAEELQRIDDALLQTAKQRKELEQSIVRTLKESSEAVKKGAAGYELYMRAADAMVAGHQKGLQVNEKTLHMEELKAAAVRELYTEYQRLSSLKLENFSGPVEANKSLEQQRELLLKLGHITDREYTFDVDGKQATVALGKIRDELAHVENRMHEVDQVWRDSKKAFSKFDTYPLRKLEGQLESMKESMSALDNELKSDSNATSFEHIYNTVLKAEAPLKNYQNSLRSLHKEQLLNAAATDEQRAKTLTEMSAVQRQTAAVSGLKKALQGVNDKMRSAGMSLSDALADPKAAMENMSADPKAMAAMEKAFQQLSSVTTEMAAARGDKQGLFSALTGEVDKFHTSLQNVETALGSVSAATEKIRLKDVSVSPEQAGSTRMSEEQQLLKTIRDEYTALQSGVDVLKNWGNLRQHMNEAARRGLDLGEENLAVLHSQDRVYDKMVAHAKKLYNDAVDPASSTSFEGKALALREAEKIAKATKQQAEDSGLIELRQDMELFTQQVQKAKVDLPYIPEHLREAQERVEILERGLRDSVTAMAATEAQGGEVYGKLGSDITRVVSNLQDWKKAQEQIYKSSEFLTSSSEKAITNKRKEIREAERLTEIMRKISKLGDSITDKSAATGVNLDSLGTASGATDLHHATKTDPKMFVDIVKANKEMGALISSMQSALGKSEHLQKVFAGYDDELKKAAAEVKQVDASLAKYAESKQRKAARSAGSNIFDVFRMSWFIQLRGFWGMYMGVTEIMQAIMQYTHTMDVMKGVTQTSATTMGELNDRFEELGRTVPIALTKTSEAALTVAKAGMSASETISIIEAASRMAYATKSDITTVADIITIATKSWDRSAHEADRISELMFAAISKSRASVEGLQQAMGYLSGIAPQANVSLQQTLGLIGMLTNAGLSMSKAATYSRQVLNDLMNPSTKLVSILGSLGVQLEEVDPRFNSLAQIFKRLHGAGMDVSQAFEGMSVRGANAFSLALSNADSLETFTDSLGEASGLAGAFAGTTQNLTSKFQLLMNAFTNAGNSMKTLLGPALMGILDGITSITNKIKWLIDALAKLGNMAGVSGAGVEGFMEAVTTLSPALVGVALWSKKGAAAFQLVREGAIAAGASTGLLSRALIFLRGTLAAISAHPIMLVITAIAALGYAIYSHMSSSRDEIAAMTDSVKQLGEEIKKINTMQIDVQRAEGIGQRLQVVKETYGGEEGKGGLENIGARLNARSVLQNFLSAAIQNGAPEVKKAARELMENMFDPEAGKAAAENYINEVIATMQNTMDNAQLDKFADLMESDEIVEKRFKTTMEYTDTGVDAVGLEANKAEVLQRSANWFTDLTTSSSLATEQLAKANPILKAFSSLMKVPARNEHVAYFEEMETKVKAIIQHMESMRDSYKAVDRELDAGFLTTLTNAEKLLSKIPDKIEEARTTDPLDTQLAKSREESLKPSDTARRQTKSGVQQSISRAIKSAEAGTGGLQYSVQLAFLAPSRKNIAEVKKRMSDAAKDINMVMQRLGDEKVGASLFSLKRESGKALIDAMNSSWEAQLEMLRTFDKDGSLSFDELLNAAYKLNKELDFSSAGISFSNFLRSVKMGELALKDVKTQAKDVPLESYTALQEKIESVADTWARMKAQGTGISPKVVASVGKTIAKLVKKQFEYIKAVIKTRSTLAAMDNEVTLTGKRLSSIFSEFGSLADTADTGIDDFKDSLRDIGDIAKDQFTEMRERIGASKNSLREITQSTVIVQDELEKLGDITGANADAAMRTEKAYASLASSAASDLSGMRGEIDATIQKMDELQKSVRSIRLDTNKGQFAYQEKRRDVAQQTQGNQNDYLFEQEKLRRESQWIESNANKGVLRGKGLENALKGMRDKYLEFAKDHPYEATGQASLKEADRLNEMVVKMQQRRQKIAELRLKIQQAALKIQVSTFNKMAEIAQGIQQVLERLTAQIDHLNAPEKETPANSLSGDGKSAVPEKPTRVGAEPSTGTAPDTAALKTDRQLLDTKITDLDKLTEELEVLENRQTEAGKAIEVFNKEMETAKAETLDFKEALKTWRDDLGTSKEIMQDMMSDTFTTVKDTSASMISDGLKAAATGEEFDAEQMMFDMNWEIIDNYIKGMVDISARNMGTDNAEWDGLFSSDANGDADRAIESSNAVLNEGVAGTGEQSLVNAGTTLQTAGQNLQNAARVMSQSTQKEQMTQMQEQQNNIQKQQNTLQERNVTAQQRNAATTQRQAAGATQRAAGNLDSAANHLKQTSAGGGGSGMGAGMAAGAAGAGGASGSFMGGAMGFMGGWGGLMSTAAMGVMSMFDSGGLITSGNRQKDSTAIGAKKGEFVISQGAVDQYGVEFFSALNNGKAKQAMEKVPGVGPIGSTTAATGGKGTSLTAPPAREGSDNGGQGKQSLRINNIVDPKAVESFLQTDRGKRAINNVVSASPYKK